MSTTFQPPGLGAGWSPNRTSGWGARPCIECKLDIPADQITGRFQNTHAGACRDAVDKRRRARNRERGKRRSGK